MNDKRRNNRGKRRGSTKRLPDDAKGEERLRVVISPKYGLNVEGTVLWLDGFPSSEGLSFLSHANLKVPTHAIKILTTRQTAALAGLRGRGVLEAPYHRPFAVGKLDLELFPSGHVPGGACLKVQIFGKVLFYAGSILPSGQTEGAGVLVPRCDLLVMESVYGEPDYAFPDRQETTEQIIGFARDILRSGRTPVFYFKDPLGKPQALAARFHLEQVEVLAHRRIQEMSRKARELGYAAGLPRRYKEGNELKGVIFWLAGSRTPRSIADRPIVKALVSGEALDPDALATGSFHRGFVLSDHADFEALLAFARAASPRRVMLLPGRTRGLLAALRKESIPSDALVSDQLDLFDAKRR